MWPPNLLQNYLPSQEGMAYNQFLKMMIIFSVAFITVLILKVSGPCPLAQGWGWGVRLCLPAAPTPAFGSVFQPSPGSSSEPAWDSGDTPLRGSGSAKAACLQVSGT